MSKQIVASRPRSEDLRTYHPLAQLRRSIRAYVTIEGVLAGLVLLALWFWISLTVDFGVHYFFKIDLLEKGRALRTILMIVAGTGLLAILTFYILRRLFRDFRSASLALILEKRYPNLLGDRLITAVELADLKRAEQQGYSVEMIKKTMKDAQERVNQVSVHSVFNWKRLLILGWLLIGATAVVLVIAYPLAVLLSLIRQEGSRSAYRMLVLNGLILLNCLFLFAIPIVCWYRSKTFRRNTRVLAATAVLSLVVTGVAVALTFSRVNAMDVKEYTWRFYNAADISLERNLLLKDTRWPTDEYYVELLDFPVPEKRIEYRKDVTVRAYFCRWIMADNHAPNGWRPVTWNDLGKVLPGEALPELPLDRIHAYLIALAEGDEGSPVGYNKGALELPDRNNIKVDLVLAVVGDKNAVNPLFTAEERQAFETLAAKLEQRAADPKLGGRQLRNVAPPERLYLVYSSLETAGGGGELDLINLDERNNVYTGRLTKVEESITLYVEGRIDEHKPRSRERQVTSVQPPKMLAMTYQEYRPAYYYHLPPYGPRGDETMDQRRKLLRNLRQTLREVRTERPPERTPITIAAGSDLKITFLTDKPLTEAALLPLSNAFPGAGEKEELAPLKIDLNPDRKSFTVNFSSAGKPYGDYIVQQWLASMPIQPRRVNPVFATIAKSMDFEVVMKDTDNMSSSRVVFVKPTEDKLPEVNLYVDIIRKHQNRYMCTTRAEIPFAKESYASDDNGLHKVEYTYEYVPLADATVTSQRAEMAAWLWASTPLQPNIGDYLFRREILLRSVTKQKGPPPIKGTFSVTSFDEALRKEAAGIKTLEKLKELIARPLPDGYVSPIINRFEFKADDRPEVFDLDKLLPQLSRKDPITGAESSFELVINVRVTDSNVQSGTDRFSENKEAPLVFKVVSLDELAAVISREEGDLARRFDEIIKKLENEQQKLRLSTSRMVTITPETAISEQTRLESIVETIVKSRELTGEIGTDYNRIIREYEVNRFAGQFTNGLRTKIAVPLAQVQTKEYVEAEDEITKLHAVLKDGRPDTALPLTGPTNLKMQLLLDRLKQIRASMGETFDLNKTINNLKRIIEGEIVFQRDIEELNQEMINRLLTIQMNVPETITVAAGQTQKVDVKLRMPETLLSDPFLRFELPASGGFKVVPAELKLKDDATEASFEIIAGTASGTYPLRIVPTQGKPVDIKVVVK